MNKSYVEDARNLSPCTDNKYSTTCRRYTRRQTAQIAHEKVVKRSNVHKIHQPQNDSPNYVPQTNVIHQQRRALCDRTATFQKSWSSVPHSSCDLLADLNVPLRQLRVMERHPAFRLRCIDLSAAYLSAVGGGSWSP